MDLKIEYDSICGTDHIESNQNNQDSISVKSDNESCVIVLADGAGSRKYAEMGAKRVSKAVAEFLYANISRIFLIDRKTLKQELYSLVKQELFRLADEHNQIGIREFGSTLLFAAVDKDTYIIGHLGDGTIMGCYKDSYPVLSFPETGPIKNSTILTTSFHAEKHLRIKKGKTLDLDGIILLSDGIFPFLFEREYIRRYREPLPVVLKRAENENHIDDASYVSVVWREFYG